MTPERATNTLLPPAPHPVQHWARLREEVAKVIEEVPLYAGRPVAPSQSEPHDISAWLASMPIINKRDLRRGFPKNMIRKSSDLKAELARGTVEMIATSGTTENRLQVLWELAWWDPQERQAMRINRRVAQAMPEGKLGFKELVLTTPVCGGSTCHVGNLSLEERTIDGMLFLNQVADPTHWSTGELDRMLGEWNGLRPDGVETDPAYLAALCRYASRTGKPMHSPSFVTLTYELATRAQRRAIEASLDAPLYVLYGATEAGVLFMECEQRRLHHNARHSHIELIDEGAGLGRVLVTTLGRTWMPLCRYDLSDLVRVADGPCPCGRETGGYLLERIEGRADDSLLVRDRWLSPAALDDAIDAAEPTVEHWQLAKDGDAFTLRVVGSEGDRAALALTTLLRATVSARPEAAILPEGSGKYRLVKP